jgi:hypothetical protein
LSEGRASGNFGRSFRGSAESGTPKMPGDIRWRLALEKSQLHCSLA